MEGGGDRWREVAIGGGRWREETSVTSMAHLEAEIEHLCPTLHILRYIILRYIYVTHLEADIEHLCLVLTLRVERVDREEADVPECSVAWRT